MILCSKQKRCHGWYWIARWRTDFKTFWLARKSKLINSGVLNAVSNVLSELVIDAVSHVVSDMVSDMSEKVSVVSVVIVLLASHSSLRSSSSLCSSSSVSSSPSLCSFSSPSSSSSTWTASASRAALFRLFSVGLYRTSGVTSRYRCIDLRNRKRPGAYVRVCWFCPARHICDWKVEKPLNMLKEVAGLPACLSNGE